MILPDKWYDWAKWFVYIFLPAFGTLYVTLGQLWDWGATEEVAATCLALATFLGITLKISETNYRTSDRGVSGDMMLMNPDEPNPNVIVAFNEDPRPLKPGDKVSLRVSNFDPKPNDVA